MKISNNYSLNFRMKFVNNNAFKEVEQYSKTIKRNSEFIRALSRLKSAMDGDVIINHGIDKNGKNFSRFIFENHIVENTPYVDESYLDATFRCILDLSYLEGRYKVLTGTNHLRTKPLSW